MIFALSSLSVVLASLSSVALAAPQQAHGLIRKPHHAVAAHQHQKRFSGRATWYDVGLGACGDYNSPGDFIVALNSHQLDTSVYPPVQCGRKVRITYQGKSAVATVKDECPGCPFGALDMSKGLFTHFTGLGTGVFQMNWDWTDGSSGNDDNGDDNKDDDKKDDDKKDNDDDKKDDDDDDKKTTKEDKPEPKTTTSTRRTTSTHRTTSKTSSSSSTSTTSSSITSSAAPAITPDTDASTTGTKDTGSNIADQQQFIANLGYMASIGKSS